MNEPLSEVIRIRVTPSHAARLGEAAALSGLSLSNYIRHRLAADDTLQEELALLRQIVADLGHLRDTRTATIETAHLVHAMGGLTLHHLPASPRQRAGTGQDRHARKQHHCRLHP